MAGAARVPRAAPNIAFAEYRSAGAAMSLSPRRRPVAPAFGLGAPCACAGGASVFLPGGATPWNPRQLASLARPARVLAHRGRASALRRGLVVRGGRARGGPRGRGVPGGAGGGRGGGEG